MAEKVVWLAPEIFSAGEDEWDSHVLGFDGVRHRYVETSKHAHLVGVEFECGSVGVETAVAPLPPIIGDGLQEEGTSRVTPTLRDLATDRLNVHPRRQEGPTICACAVACRARRP